MMTKPVRYQKGQLYRDHGAWFVRYRVRVRQEDGSIRLQRKSKRLGSLAKHPKQSDIEPLREAFMQKINSGVSTPESSMTLTEFVETVYLPWAQAEKRASTHKGYKEIWENHLLKRIGQIRLREFRTVHASKLLRAIAAECDLTKTTLQHIKGVLSGIFTFAKNEGAFDGSNPVQGAMIPGIARERGKLTPTTWFRFFGFWRSCHCSPRPLSRQPLLQGCAKASCADWSGRITQASSLR